MRRIHNVITSLNNKILYPTAKLKLDTSALWVPTYQARPDVILGREQIEIFPDFSVVPFLSLL